MQAITIFFFIRAGQAKEMRRDWANTMHEKVINVSRLLVTWNFLKENKERISRK